MKNEWEVGSFGKVDSLRYVRIRGLFMLSPKDRGGLGKRHFHLYVRSYVVTLCCTYSSVAHSVIRLDYKQENVDYGISVESVTGGGGIGGWV